MEYCLLTVTRPEHRVDGLRNLRAACFINAAGVDPDMGDTSLVGYVESVQYLCDALLSAQSGAARAS